MHGGCLQIRIRMAFMQSAPVQLCFRCPLPTAFGCVCTSQAPCADTLRLWLLYQTWIGQLLLLLPPTWWILSWQHHRVAKHADSPESKKDIPKFIKVRRGPGLHWLYSEATLRGSLVGHMQPAYMQPA